VQLCDICGRSYRDSDQGSTPQVSHTVQQMRPCCRRLDESVLSICHIALTLHQVTFIFLACLKMHPGIHRFQSDAGVEEAVSQ
jgi:hypothetical protein